MKLKRNAWRWLALLCALGVFLPMGIQVRTRAATGDGTFVSLSLQSETALAIQAQPTLPADSDTVSAITPMPPGATDSSEVIKPPEPILPQLLQTISLDYQVTVNANDTQLYDSGATFSNSGVLGGGQDEVGYESSYPFGVVACSFRWPSVTIPAGATITSNTYISLNCAKSTGSNGKFRLYFDDSATPTAPTSTATFSGKTLTTNYTSRVSSDYSATWGWQSTNCASIVSELYASYSYSSGAAMQAIFKDNGSSNGDNYLAIYDYAAGTPSYAAKLHIEYVTAPTATVSAATSVTTTTATLNGNVTGTGGENPNVTQYWGTTDGGTTAGNWANNSAPTSPGQPQGVASFYKNITGLSAGTLYYYNAKATNSGGTGWGTSGSFTTLSVALTNSSASIAFGIVASSHTYYAKGSAPSNPVADADCTQTITNTGTAAIDINVKETNPTGGVGWTLTSGAPGSDTIRDTVYYSGKNPASGVILTTSYQAFYSNLAASATKKWDMKRETGTFSDGAQKTSTVTFTAVAH
jgi:hypothetical protein